MDPKLHAREDETDFEVRICVRLMKPVERSSEVILLTLEPWELVVCQAYEHRAVVRLRAGEVVVRMQASRLVERVALAEALEGELPDRLEHPEASV